MVRWFVDKNSKVPLYVQLKDQIQYYISTGAVRTDDQLPPVKALARELGINFETVRKAYKELEREGLITMKRSEGSFISLHKPWDKRSSSFPRNGRPSKPDGEDSFSDAAKGFIRQYLRQGLLIDDARRILSLAFTELEQEDGSPIVIFAECNQFQVKEISGLLAEKLRLNIKPILISNLEKELPVLIREGKVTSVITTGFHVNEVSQAVGDLPVNIEILITNLNPETRRQLEAIGESAKFGFICRDQESALIYKDLLKAELGFEQIQLDSCTLAEAARVRTILNSADVVLASPPVYEEVRKLAPPGQSVFNVFERVDPMSLKVLKDRILGDGKLGG